MEIEFNPNQVRPKGPNEVVGRAMTSRSSADTAAPSEGPELLSQLNTIPLSRPDKVEGLKPLGSSSKYPPLETLDRIATLLAIHLKT